MAKLDGLTVRRMVPEDRPRWIEAFEGVFGAPLGGIASAPHFEWCYLAVPENRLWGMVAAPVEQAEPGGEIAASYSMIPRRFWIDGRERMGALSLDTLTTPAWRKRGLFVHLAQACYREAAAEGLDFVYGFPNPNSIHGFVTHLGWKLAPDPRTTMTVRPLSFVAGWLRGGGGEGRRGSVRARVVDEADARFDALWERARDRAGAWAVRDAAFYRWRAGRPGARYALAVAEDDHDTLLAVCLTATVDRAEGPRGYLLDVLAPAENDETLAWLVRWATARLAAEQHVKITQATTSPGSPFEPVLARAGFRPVPARFRTDIKLGWAPVGDTLGEDAVAADRWRVSYVDTDTV